jgi:hypothetical protein
MKTIINGVTAEIKIELKAKRSHLTTFKSVEKMVDYMTNKDVIYKSANIGDDLYTISLEKTDEANENEYEKSMQIHVKGFPQPDLETNLWK